MFTNPFRGLFQKKLQDLTYESNELRTKVLKEVAGTRSQSRLMLKDADKAARHVEEALLRSNKADGKDTYSTTDYAMFNKAQKSVLAPIEQATSGEGWAGLFGFVLTRATGQIDAALAKLPRVVDDMIARKGDK